MSQPNVERLEKVMTGVREVFRGKIISLSPSDIEAWRESRINARENSAQTTKEPCHSDNLLRPDYYQPPQWRRSDLDSGSAASAIPPTPSSNSRVSSQVRSNEVAVLQNRFQVQLSYPFRSAEGLLLAPAAVVDSSARRTLTGRLMDGWRRLSRTSPKPVGSALQMNNESQNRSEDIWQTPGITRERVRFSGANDTRDVEAHSGIDENMDWSSTPGGRLLAWSMVLGSFLVTFTCWGLVTAFGVFQAYYSHTMLRSEPAEKIAWIGSIQLFFMFFLGIPVGLGMDRGWFRILFNGGTLLLVSSVFGTSFCTEWWQLFIVQGLLVGFSMGLVSSSSTVVLTGYFTSQFGIATVVSATGASLGAIVYSLVFQSLVASHGFAGAMRAVGCVLFGGMLIPTIIMQPSPDARRSHPLTFRLATLGDIPYLFMVFGCFFAFWSLFIAIYYMPSYALELGLDAYDAANILVAMFVCSVPGRLVATLVSHRYMGPLDAFIPACFTSSVVMFIWTACTTRASLFAAASVYGFATGGMLSLYGPMVQGFANKDPDSLGQKKGLAIFVISVACLTGTPLAGALIAGSGYIAAQFFAGSCLLIGGLLMCCARVGSVGWAF